MENIVSVNYTYDSYVKMPHIMKHIVSSRLALYFRQYKTEVLQQNLFKSCIYKPLTHQNILSLIRATGSIDSYIRLIGMDALDYIKLKKDIVTKTVFKKSWAALNSTNVDFTDEDKYDSITILNNLLTIGLANNRTINSTCHQTKYICYATLKEICKLFGWKKSIHGKSNLELILEIIDCATYSFPQNISLKYSEASNYSRQNNLNLSVSMMITLIPDINLFAIVGVYYYGEYRATSLLNFIERNNVSDFISMQIFHYYVCNKRHYLTKGTKVILSELKQAIYDSNSNTIKHMLSVDNKISEYSSDNWYTILEAKDIKLQYSDDPLYLSSEKIARENPTLYDQLISIKNADSFLDYMSMNKRDVFYSILNITCANDHMIAKKEMFMAFAVGHMIELLLTCGLILTEDTFSALVGSKVNDRNIMLLKTGILIRHAMRGVKLDKSNMDNITPSVNTCCDLNNQEYRISVQRSLELLCEYFIGLEKIITIKAPVPTKINSGYCTTKYNTDMQTQNFNTSVELREYPIQLVNSVIEAVDNPTNESYALHIALKEHQNIGASGISFDVNTPLTTSIKEITQSEMNIFQYFTGNKSIEEFRVWARKLCSNIQDGRLSDILLLAQQGLSYYYIEDVVYAILVICIVIRDFMMLRIKLNDIIKQSIQDNLFSNMNAELFTKLYRYAKIIVSLEEYKIRRIEVKDSIATKILWPMYHNIIPSTADKFTVNTKYNSFVNDALYSEVTKAHLLNMTDNMCKLPIQQMGGKCLQLIPWVGGIIENIPAGVIQNRHIPYNMQSIKTVSLVQGYTLDIVYPHQITTTITHPIQSSSKVIYNFKKANIPIKPVAIQSPKPVVIQPPKPVVIQYPMKRITIINTKPSTLKAKIITTNKTSSSKLDTTTSSTLKRKQDNITLVASVKKMKTVVSANQTSQNTSTKDMDNTKIQNDNTNTSNECEITDNDVYKLSTIITDTKKQKPRSDNYDVLLSHIIDSDDKTEPTISDTTNFMSQDDNYFNLDDGNYFNLDDDNYFTLDNNLGSIGIHHAQVDSNSGR